MAYCRSLSIVSLDTVVQADMCIRMNNVCACSPASLHQQWADDLSLVSQWLFCSATCQSTLPPCLVIAKACLNSPFSSAHLASYASAVGADQTTSHSNPFIIIIIIIIGLVCPLIKLSITTGGIHVLKIQEEPFLEAGLIFKPFLSLFFPIRKHPSY